MVHGRPHALMPLEVSMAHRFGADFWDVRSPANPPCAGSTPSEYIATCGPASPLNVPVTPPSTFMNAEPPPMPHKPRSPTKHLRRLSSGSSCAFDHDELHEHDSWATEEMFDIGHRSPPMALVPFAVCLPQIMEGQGPRVGPGTGMQYSYNSPKVSSSISESVSLAKLDLSGTSEVGDAMDCSPQQGGHREVHCDETCAKKQCLDPRDTSWQSEKATWGQGPDASMHLGDSMMSAMDTDVRKPNIGSRLWESNEAGPGHIDAEAVLYPFQQRLPGTPLPATRLFHPSPGQHQPLDGSPGTPPSPASPRVPEESHHVALGMSPMCPLMQNRRFSFSPRLARLAGGSPQQRRSAKISMAAKGRMVLGHAASPSKPLLSFESDFFGFQEVGRGSFGKVFKCTRKIDLQQYAVKEVVREFGSERDKERMLKEIYALSAVRDNVHVVRYYSAWEESGKLFIQMELCSGTLAQQRSAQGPLGDTSVRVVMSHIASGLSFVHGANMVHLDVKPENIYTTDAGVYKLGDLGLASPADMTSKAEEGDKRYLSREMLQSEECDLRKADVFALGASLYEIASPSPLPTQGDEYHRLRDGSVPQLPLAISQAIQSIICTMMHPDPVQRPSASEVADHPDVRSLLRDANARCLSASSCPMLVNTARALERHGYSKMKRRADKAEMEVKSLEAQLQVTLEEVRVWKKRSENLSTSHQGGFWASMDLHTVARLGSSPMRGGGEGGVFSPEMGPLPQKRAGLTKTHSDFDVLELPKPSAGCEAEGGEVEKVGESRT